MFRARTKAASVGKYSANRSELYSESNSEAVQNILHTIDKIAPTDANVLLLGENGTGKYVLAEQIHRKSPRSKEPFVHIDLGSLPEGLLKQNSLAIKGSFTDAIADTAGKIENARGGTVFLDEIGNLPLHLQAKLLTLIQNKNYPVSEKPGTANGCPLYFRDQ